METGKYHHDANAQSGCADFRRIARILRCLLAAAALAALPAVTYADLVVDDNLGPLPPGSYPLSGTTVGGPNNADIYDITNPNLFWVEEHVYQFSVGATSRISLESDDPNGGFPGTDNDFFLTDTLATTVLGAKNQGSALSFVEVSGPLSVVPSGVYFLIVDAFRGSSLGNASGAGPYNAILTVADLVAPVATPAFEGGSITSFLEPGEIEWYSFSHLGGPFTVDTIGSTLGPGNDTELFLYDALGFRVAQNDDIAATNFLSRIAVPALAPGEYYLAAGGYDSVGAADGWGASSNSGETGPLVINGLTVVPEPSTAVLGACGAVAALGYLARRR